MTDAVKHRAAALLQLVREGRAHAQHAWNKPSHRQRLQGAVS